MPLTPMRRNADGIGAAPEGLAAFRGLADFRCEPGGPAASGTTVVLAQRWFSHIRLVFADDEFV